jgi:hypothetical protein
MSLVPATIRVLAVDDHPLLREGIAGLIADESDMTLVAQAANGREAIEQFRSHRPDVTLMDLQMPEMSGVEATSAYLRGISGRADYRADHVYRRCAGCARHQGGSQRVPAEEFDPDGAPDHHSRGSCRQKGHFTGNRLGLCRQCAVSLQKRESCGRSPTGSRTRRSA